METYYDKVAIFQQFVNLQEYRQKLPLNAYLDTLFQLSQLTIQSQYDKSTKKPNPKLKRYRDVLEERFIEAYQTLTPLEKLDMYIRQMKCVKDIIENNIIEDNNVPEILEGHQAYTLSYSLHIWRKKDLKLKHSKGMLEISRQKKTKQYDLRNYLIRESKNSQYNCFVLEAINNKVTQKNLVVRVGFKSIPVFQEWFLAVKASLIKMQREKIRDELLRCPKNKIEDKSIDIKTQKSQQISYDSVNIKQQISLGDGNLNNTLSQGSDITIKTIIQSLLDNSQSSQATEDIQAAPVIKKHMNLFEIIMPDYRLDSLPETYFCDLIHSEDDMKIFRNNDHQQRYKVFIPTKQKDFHDIVKILFNVQTYSEWNPAIEESHIKNIISSENMVIVSEKHKQYNTIYRARDFVYLRHVFCKDKNVYMVDKSITNSSYPPYMIVVRGNIGCVWGIMKQETDQYTIIADVMIQNQGLINAGQDHNLAMVYLKGLLNIRHKIEISRQEKSTFSVFDLDWNIDNATNGNVYVGSKSTSPSNFRKQSESIFPQKPEKTGYEKKRRQTIQQQQKRQEEILLQQRKRRVTVQQNVKKQTPQKSSTDNKALQESRILVKIPITSVNYQFNAREEVIIPQDYLNNQYLLAPSAPKQPLLQEVVNGHAIWKGEWRFQKTGGIVFINEAKMEHQKGVFKFVLGKIAKNLLSGKSILHISLPVDIFSPQTNLERFAFSMTYAPLIIQRALKCKTAIQKFKHVIAYGITNSVLYLNMEKPFNPILGETFQGWINGCPIYLQQISHHPPIASFLFLGRGYKIIGSLESKVEMQMNSGCGITDGVYRIITDDGSDFNFITPGGEISGLTFGDRKFNLVGKYYVWSKRHQLFVSIKLDPTNKGFFSKRSQPSDYMEGNIYEVTRQFIEDFQLMKKKNEPAKQNIIHDFGKASGIWSKILLVEGQTYLDLDKEIACKLQYDGHMLPSDGVWREDVAYKKLNDNHRSQIQKQRLQNIQRNDRKLREKYGGSHH